MVTEHEILTALLSVNNIKYFWKDADRRFLGASQSFLDYYGFSSVDMILGRNDEDMGWHIDPAPYRDDEYLVLKDGRSVYSRPGTCIIKGQVRNIQATKVPIRGENGEIKGLVGFFEDVTDSYLEKERFRTVVHIDPVTGLINRNGFFTVIEDFLDEYNRCGTDFVAFYIDIDHFSEVNEEYGHRFGDELLWELAEDMKKVVGNNSVLLSFGGDEFVVLHQIPSDDDPAPISKSVWDIHDQIEAALTRVHYIDNHSYRPEVSIGFAAYSEAGSAAKLIELANVTMISERRAKKEHEKGRRIY